MEIVVSYTLDNTAMLKKTYSPWTQTLREWMMWGIFSYVMPEDAGLKWLYCYQWQSVLINEIDSVRKRVSVDKYCWYKIYSSPRNFKIILLASVAVVNAKRSLSRGSATVAS